MSVKISIIKAKTFIKFLFSKLFCMCANFSFYLKNKNKEVYGGQTAIDDLKLHVAHRDAM